MFNKRNKNQMEKLVFNVKTVRATTQTVKCYGRKAVTFLFLQTCESKPVSVIKPVEL